MIALGSTAATWRKFDRETAIFDIERKYLVILHPGLALRCGTERRLAFEVAGVYRSVYSFIGAYTPICWTTFAPLRIRDAHESVVRLPVPARRSPRPIKASGEGARGPIQGIELPVRASRQEHDAWPGHARQELSVRSGDPNARTGRNWAATGSVFPLSQFATCRNS